MPQLSKRTEYFTDSVIRRMTRISDQYNAINLSQGFPDFDPPKEITEALAEIARKGPHQYSVTYGAENFREALAGKAEKNLCHKINPETEIVVTCGGTEAMMTAMMTVCNPGEKVIIFSPFYENYSADTILSGAEPIYVPLIPPDFHFNKEALEAAFKEKPKAIVVCNPSNPTGKVFTKEELLTIGELAIKYDTFVITDEVYEHIIFKPHQHISMASLPGMYERTITCSSLSKTYSITGWRLGYLIGPESVIEVAKKVHDFLTVGAASPLQEAAVVGLKFGQEYYDNLQKLYTEKRDFFVQGLKKLNIPHTVPQGSYFIMVDISEYLAKEQFKDYTDYDFCIWMIKNIGVAAVPGSSFFKEKINNYIRLHFAREKSSLEEVLLRLAKLNEL